MQNTLGRRVAGGCSAFLDVHKGLILHATPFLDNESPETRKYPATEVGWFRKTKESEGSLHEIPQYVWDFTQADDSRRFSYDEEVANKAFMSRLTRDEIEITYGPSVHAEAVTKH